MRSLSCWERTEEEEKEEEGEEEGQMHRATGSQNQQQAGMKQERARDHRFALDVLFLCHR